MMNENVDSSAQNDELCEWNGSLVDLNECTGRMEDVKIMKSSKGGMKINGGEIVIIQSQFEENNPKYEKYPSLRRNLICEAGGRVMIESLKGGDGIQNGTSLWLLPGSSSECEFIDGITKDRKSLF
jgi:hypothetical protein